MNCESQLTSCSYHSPPIRNTLKLWNVTPVVYVVNSSPPLFSFPHRIKKCLARLHSDNLLQFIDLVRDWCTSTTIFQIRSFCRKALFHRIARILALMKTGTLVSNSIPKPWQTLSGLFASILLVGMQYHLPVGMRSAASFTTDCVYSAIDNGIVRAGFLIFFGLELP
jgi:uncharacterized membrane protein